MFSVKYATTFSQGLYRTEDGCARGCDGPQLRQGSADSEVLNCRYQAFTLTTGGKSLRHLGRETTTEMLSH